MNEQRGRETLTELRMTDSDEMMVAMKVLVFHVTEKQTEGQTNNRRRADEKQTVNALGLTAKACSLSLWS